MCGVSACENRQNRVSHGESVRVGSSGLRLKCEFSGCQLSYTHCIVLFCFIVCYLLNMLLFYLKYDVCSRM